MSKEIEEIFADLEHERWLGWMKYLFTKGRFNPDGSFTIEANSVVYWQKEIETKYQDLTEIQKESDRKEVRKYYQYYQTLLSLLEKEKERVRLLETVDTKHGIKLVDRLEKAEERIKELEGAIRQAQEDNPDEKHCTCVPLLKVKIKELEVAHQTAGMMINNQQKQIEQLIEKIRELEKEDEDFIKILVNTRNMATESLAKMRERAELAEAQLASIKAGSTN